MTWLGAHGIGAFLVVGFLVAFAVVAGHVLWRHGDAAHAAGRLDAGRLRRRRLAAALAVLALAVALFTALALSLASGGLDALDAAYAQALHRELSPAAVAALSAATHLGDTATFTVLGIVVGVALFGVGRPREAIAWVVAVGLQGLVTLALKSAFERARPERADGVVVAHGFSFPSGHTAGATVVYGMLAWLVLVLAPARWHVPALVVAVVLAWTTGFSRIVLQAHHPSDVLAGYASGGLWLAACVAAAEAMRTRAAAKLSRT